MFSVTLLVPSLRADMHYSEAAQARAQAAAKRGLPNGGPTQTQTSNNNAGGRSAAFIVGAFETCFATTC
jgi:hypothetical protein